MRGVGHRAYRVVVVVLYLCVVWWIERDPIHHPRWRGAEARRMVPPAGAGRRRRRGRKELLESGRAVATFHFQDFPFQDGCRQEAREWRHRHGGPVVHLGHAVMTMSPPAIVSPMLELPRLSLTAGGSLAGAPFPGGRLLQPVRPLPLQLAQQQRQRGSRPRLRLRPQQQWCNQRRRSRPAAQHSPRASRFASVPHVTS